MKPRWVSQLKELEFPGKMGWWIWLGEACNKKKTHKNAKKHLKLTQELWQQDKQKWEEKKHSQLTQEVWQRQRVSRRASTPPEQSDIRPFTINCNWSSRVFWENCWYNKTFGELVEMVLKMLTRRRIRMASRLIRPISTFAYFLRSIL